MDYDELQQFAGFDAIDTAVSQREKEQMILKVKPLSKLDKHAESVYNEYMEKWALYQEHRSLK